MKMQDYYGLLAFGIVIVIFIWFTSRRKKMMKILNYRLNKKGDVDGYLALLDSGQARVLFSRITLLLLKLDGAIIKHDSQLTKSIIKQLDSVPLFRSKQFQYYQKRFNFFIFEKEFDEAMTSFQLMKEYAEKLKKPKVTSPIILQAQLMIEIFINKNVDLIPALEKQETLLKDGPERGMVQYYLAILYFEKNDEKQVKKYTLKAQENLKGANLPKDIESLRKSLK